MELFAKERDPSWEKISGLQYIPDFISPKQEADLLAHIQQSPWLGDLRRRVQHYGYKYDYKSRTIDHSMHLGELPPWTLDLAQALLNQKLFSQMPDQVIVNEYQPGQGIANHVDCEPCFDQEIASLSLGSACQMDFTLQANKSEVVSIYLEARSLILLSGEARYDWQHGIKARKSDWIGGKRVARGTRTSLTFRKVIIKDS